MTKSTFAVIIQQAKTEPWESIWKEGQIPTWVDRYKEKYPIINCSGIPMGKLWSKFDQIHEKFRFSSRFGKWQGRLDYLFVPWLRRNLPASVELPHTEIREIQIKTNSSYLFAGRRILGTIKWFVEQSNYDFAFLTTTSSFVNVELLSNVIDTLDCEREIYAGHVLGSSNNAFVTGSGILINRVSAVKVLESYKKYPFNMLNDIALGFLLRKIGILPQNIPWIWLESMDNLRVINDYDLINIFHFRCKSKDSVRRDSQIMQSLHKRLIELKGKGMGVY